MTAPGQVRMVGIWALDATVATIAQVLNLKKSRVHQWGAFLNVPRCLPDCLSKMFLVTNL